MDEVLQLAGVATLTLPPSLLHPLSNTKMPEEKVAGSSLFNHESSIQEQEMGRQTFIDDEAKFREAYAKNEGGKGQLKTSQVLSIFLSSHFDLLDLLM
jgi:hypothetical protein